MVLDQALVDSFYGAVKTLVTVDPNPEVQDGPKWFKVVISASMLIALLFAAAFTGGLVERLIGRNLTGLVGRRAVPQSDHVIVVGLGQVGLRLCLLLREPGIAVVAIDDHARRRQRRPGAAARHPGRDRPRRRPVAAAPAVDRQGAGAGRRHVGRPAEHQGRRSPPAPSPTTCGWSCARAPTRRAGRRARSSASATSATCTASAPCTSPGLALGSAAAHVVVDGDTAHLRRRRRHGALPVPGRGLTAPPAARSRRAHVRPARTSAAGRGTQRLAPAVEKPILPETWPPGVRRRRRAPATRHVGETASSPAARLRGGWGARGREEGGVVLLLEEGTRVGGRGAAWSQPAPAREVPAVSGGCQRTPARHGLRRGGRRGRGLGGRAARRGERAEAPCREGAGSPADSAPRVEAGTPRSAGNNGLEPLVPLVRDRLRAPTHAARREPPNHAAPACRSSASRSSSSA